MTNELVNGTSRVGDFFDMDESTPEVKVLLQRSDQGISLRVAWSSLDNPYASWFVSDTMTVVGSAGVETAPRSAPARVLFSDSYGTVLLIGCRAQGFHMDAFGPGIGTIWADAAVLGVRDDIDFERPDGLRTEISGLRDWLGLSSWREYYDASTGAVTLSSLRTPSVDIGRVGEVALRVIAGWRVIPEENRLKRTLLDLVWCETVADSSIEQREHRQLHLAIRDLLVISRWYEESCIETSIMRRDDPLPTADGSPHGEQWRDMVVPNDARAPYPTGYRPHLIMWRELGCDGVLRWLALRDEFARALDPILSSIGLRTTTANTLLAQSGPGIEALGYLLFLRDGLTPNAAGKKTLRMRLTRISSDLTDCLPFDTQEWIKETVAAYNGIKHANRSAPDAVLVANVWRRSVLAVRAWVALELGVDREQVSARLADDPQAHPYVAR